MNCKYQKNIYRVVDGKLKGAEQAQFQKHLLGCLVCQKEAGAIQKLDALIKMSAVSIEPSPNFDGIFWQKVFQRQSEPWVVKVWRHFESLIPTPNFSQALVALLIAFFVGSTGGAISIFGSTNYQNEPAIYLSGSPEYKGIPSASVAASYLKTIEGKSR